MKKKQDIIIKKLNQDDILEIVLEYFQENEVKGMSAAKGIILGKPNKDLRFIGVFSEIENNEVISQYDLKKLDEEMDFNGDHSFFDKHPEFYIDETKK